MSEEIDIDGKTYVSSKRASEISAYAQDYIGQLARSSLIDARRMGGLWYVSMDSIEAYKKEPETSKDYGEEKSLVRTNVPESLVSFDGKDYISANRASKLTGYNQDYVGQLARGGKILSRQVGKRWYVDRDGIIAHKDEKDALLAAVQSQSVGIDKKGATSTEDHSNNEDVMSYQSDPRDDTYMMPPISKDLGVRDGGFDESNTYSNNIPIRVVNKRPQEVNPRISRQYTPNIPQRTSRRKTHKSMYIALIATGLICIAYIAFMKFPFSTIGGTSISAGGAKIVNIGNAILDTTANALEPILSNELSYQRIDK